MPHRQQPGPRLQRSNLLLIERVVRKAAFVCQFAAPRRSSFEQPNLLALQFVFLVRKCETPVDCGQLFVESQQAVAIDGTLPGVRFFQQGKLLSQRLQILPGEAIVVRLNA